MKKIIFLLYLSLSSLLIYGQNSSKVQSIISMNSEDTLSYVQFGKRGNEIFSKAFPKYGVSLIRSKKYSEDKQEKFIWAHSNVGFVIVEYDSVPSLVKEYKYKLANQDGIKNLMSFNSFEQLESSEQCQNVQKKGKKYLSAEKFYTNNLLVKEFEYDSKGVKDVITYTYANEKLIKKHNVYGRNGASNTLIYHYTDNGELLSWSKIFNDVDTAFTVVNTYEKGKKVKEQHTEEGIIDATIEYKYKKDKLKSYTKKDKHGEVKISKIYFYRKDDKVDYIDVVNDYMNEKIRVHYLYYE